MRTMTVVLGALSITTPAIAQTSPYAAEAPRAIAALSDEEIAQLADGAGMGFALTAELNGIPGPRHVLELADSLHLDNAQRALVADVFTRMQAEARELGTEILARERELNALFADGNTEMGVVEVRSVELGRLYGRLRAVHLNAHLETSALMHPVQVRRYAELRGYRDPAAPADHTAHH